MKFVAGIIAVLPMLAVAQSDLVAKTSGTSGSLNFNIDVRRLPQGGVTRHFAFLSRGATRPDYLGWIYLRATEGTALEVPDENHAVYKANGIARFTARDLTGKYDTSRNRRFETFRGAMTITLAANGDHQVDVNVEFTPDASQRRMWQALYCPKGSVAKFTMDSRMIDFETGAVKASEGDATSTGSDNGTPAASPKAGAKPAKGSQPKARSEQPLQTAPETQGSSQSEGAAPSDADQTTSQPTPLSLDGADQSADATQGKPLNNASDLNALLNGQMDGLLEKVRALSPGDGENSITAKLATLKDQFGGKLANIFAAAESKGLNLNEVAGIKSWDDVKSLMLSKADTFLGRLTGAASDRGVDAAKLNQLQSTTKETLEQTVSNYSASSKKPLTQLGDMQLRIERSKAQISANRTRTTVRGEGPQAIKTTPASAKDTTKPAEKRQQARITIRRSPTAKTQPKKRG